MSELFSALAAAREAGELLRRLWPAARAVRVKGFRDIVTEADFAAQNAIVARLKRDFPDYAVLAEEGGPGVSRAGDRRPMWIIDPIDGTRNFAKRIPLFSVAIALAEGARVRVGVVHDPLHDLTFYAEAGQGAYLQRGSAGEPERLWGSDITKLSEAVVGVDWSHRDEVRRQVLDALDRVALSCSTVRALGSASLGMAYVASGWLDAYYHFALHPWDVAAPSVIVAEAGGRLTTPEGGEWALDGTRVVISNGRFHDELLKTVGYTGR